MLGFYGLDKNRDKVLKARAALAATAAKPLADRVKRHKERVADEMAARAGVVTIQQAEVTFMELNMLAYDTLGEAFSEWVDIQFGQQAVYKNRYRRQIRVNLGHLAGTPPGHNFLTVQAHTNVPTFEYFSEEIMVPNLVNTQYDLEKFQEKEQMLIELAHDMRLFRQTIIINMMLGQPLLQDLSVSIPAYAALTAPYNNRLPFVLDKQITAGAVPQTNILSNSSEGGLTKNVFKFQRTWANQMDKELRSMFVPIAGAPWEAYWDQASIVAYAGGSNQDVTKAIPPSKWEEAENMSFRRNGARMNWFGSEIFLQPLNILPQGYALISTDGPAVLGWNKLDDAVSDEERIFGNRNLNRRYEKRSAGLAQPDPLLPNFVCQRFA